MSSFRLAMAGLALALACTSPTADNPMSAPSPAGPAPAVVASLQFSEAPLDGFLYLRPTTGSSNWRYAIDLDGDGEPEHEGILTREIGFAYRFVSPGIHEMEVSLTGPSGVEVTTLAAVVNDPSAIQILAQRNAAVSPDGIFEGITVSRAGTSLFVGDFRHSEIHRLSPATLAPLGPPLPLRPGFGEGVFVGGAEGMSVPPSDTLLQVAHKCCGLSVVAIPSMEIRRSVKMNGEFFIHALDDTTALTPGWFFPSRLELIDTRTGQGIRGLPVPRAWHFAVSASGERVAVLDRSSPPALHVATIPDLVELARVPLPLWGADIVAFDPAGDRAYVMGTSAEGAATFVLVDVVAGRVLRTMILNVMPCGFCVANPVATLRNGRFVAVEQASGVLLIDTALDLPRYLFLSGWSVAASPTEDALFTLLPDGTVSKIAIQP